MAKARLTIIEDPHVGVMIEASGDYEPGHGGYAEELLVMAVKVVSDHMAAREDMSAPHIIGGETESIRQVYGDAVASKHDTPKPASKKTIEPGTILRFGPKP